MTFGRLAASQLEKDRLRDDASGALREHAGLGNSRGSDIPDGVRARIPRRQGGEVDGSVAVFGHAA
jgi:hypothetical protein